MLTVKLNLGLKDRAATWQMHTGRVFWQLGRRQEMLEKKKKKKEKLRNNYVESYM